jgi:predicted ATPase
MDIEMKLVYLWIENYEERIKNMELTICNSYHINYNIESSTLNISKNKEYIRGFYGKNILDITAIVGQNGVGKTTLTRCLYDLCESVYPVSKEHSDYITKHILVFETGRPRQVIVYYYLSHSLKIETSGGVNVISVPLKGLQKEKLMQAVRQHDLTTIYFTNSFEVNHVIPNQGMSEFTEGEKHKSLSFSPMISLNRAFNSLKDHYGARKKGGMLLLDVINQYAEKMCTNFKSTYATALSYNFLMAVRHFPDAIVRILPVERDFKLSITEFGEYIKFQENYVDLSQFDQTVYFIRKNIYEHIACKFKRDHWQQIYVNILCEIVLFLNVFGDYQNVQFNILKQRHILIESDEALEIMLKQVRNNEETAAKKELIKKIRNVRTVDMNILKEFLHLTDEDSNILSSSVWYKQVWNLFNTYNDVKNIEIDRTINYGYVKLVDLILSQYENDETVYGRMINVIPNPMSSGELALINMFSTVYRAMKMHTSTSILLIIDEIDAFLHPRWQQTILTHITRWINESKEFNDKKVQLIIATHSPIILSDIPSEKVVYLEKPCKVKNNTQLTFGANINMLFYDSFFMDQGSIGEIAKKKIQDAMNVVNNKAAKQSEIDEAIYIIDNIGEKFVREKLKTHPRYIEEKAKRQE